MNETADRETVSGGGDGGTPHMSSFRPMMLLPVESRLPDYMQLLVVNL
jgi:hypothetical protein